MERRQVLVHAVDEPRVDRLRNVRAIELHRERRRVVARLGEELQLLGFAVHDGAERPAELAETLEERRHHLLAIRAIRHAAIRGEVRLVDDHRLAVAQRDRRIGKVGVRQDVVDVGRRCRRAVRRRRGSSLRDRSACAARGGRCPRDRTDRASAAVRRRGTSRRCRSGQPQNLGLDERGLRAERRRHLGHLLLHALMLGESRVSWSASMLA